MNKNILNIVNNHLERDDNGIWVLDRNRKFNYSDGVDSEKYLQSVLSSAEDLSSNSYELEQSIIDWNSEYHLSRKRSQLLRGFDYNKSKKVLEVGCGCGAITRFLGETFNEVVAIEGSIARAEIARMRTKDLNNVSIVCAPFQEISFKEKFDIIFCIGVFEYSNMFVNSQDPYNDILEYFHDILSPDGEVIIAIENQFGLKYFSSATEDHSGVMFDGLEGYTRFDNRNAKTFGLTDLKTMLGRKFQKVDFYFPFPDYKMPSCVLSSEFLDKTDAGELVGMFEDTSLLDHPQALFDERLVLLEIAKNKMLPFFANSFLVIGGKSKELSVNLSALGLIYSSSRIEKFQTVTKFVEDSKGGVVAKKDPQSGEQKVIDEKVVLHCCESEWINGSSIHTEILKRVKDKSLTLAQIFSPCQIWLEKMSSYTSRENNSVLLEGKYLDCIWRNAFNVNGECKFIDLEWEWREPITLNRLLIKSIFELLNDIERLADLNPKLSSAYKGSLIKNIAKELGFTISNSDLSDFCNQEAEIAEIIYGSDKKQMALYFKLNLFNRKLTSRLQKARVFYHRISRRLKRSS